MCGGVHFDYQGEVYKSFFPNPYANLPVIKRDGVIELLPWGRRKEQPGNLPLGGWARLDSIYGGRWDKYFPVSVKIPVLRFMEKDYEGRSHWYDLIETKCLQGLIAKDGNETRIYVVTIEATFPDSEIHDRSPRVIEGLQGKTVIDGVDVSHKVPRWRL